MQRPITLTLTLGLLGALACSPSSKNEKQYWTNHQANLTTQAAKYPGFKEILNAHKTEAEVVMKAAEALTDEDKKAEQMKAANASITRVLGKMVEVKTKSESLRKKIDDLNRLKLPKAKHARRNETVMDAQATLREVERRLTEAAPANDQEAIALLGEEISTLISAQGAAKRSYDSLKPKKAKKKKSKKRKKK